MKRPEISARAEADLDEIWLYVAEDNPPAADRLVARVRDQCDTLAQFPEMGPRRDELATGLRSFPVGTYIVF